MSMSNIAQDKFSSSHKTAVVTFSDIFFNAEVVNALT